MSIVTISRGSYSRGKEVAEKVARKLGYECIARDLLLEASEEFHIPEIKLVRAIHDAPSIFDSFTKGKEKYISYFQSALLRHLEKDNMVYHGLAGHFFVKGITHVLKVRIIADMEDRVKLEMEREKISRSKALHILEKDDSERRKWSQHLYGIDTWDSSLYDLVIHIRKITVDDAVEIICHTVGLKHFRTTPDSQKVMDDLFLASQVRVALVDVNPEIQVYADNGRIVVETMTLLSEEEKLTRSIEAVAKTIPGVEEITVKVHLHPMESYD